MQTDCRVITAELDQLAPSSFVAYRHDHSRMATLANDGLVRVFTPGDSEQQWDLLCQTNLKDGKPIQGCWAHADFGALLAVLTDKGDIVILEEASQSSKVVLRGIARLSHEGCQVFSFGPKEEGLQLASACSRGHIRIQQAQVSRTGREWVLQQDFKASSSGACTAMCWRPHTASLPAMILLGTEHGAKVFFYVSRHMSWEVAAEFAEGHITDVVWAVPAGGHAPEFVATASGRTASVWKLAGPAEQLQVCKAADLDHTADVCQVEWNAGGTWLAGATADGSMSLWRQNLLGNWKLVSTTSCVDPGSFAMVD